jgi:quercetin dioxygenase-like cupin family protein
MLKREEEIPCENVEKAVGTKIQWLITRGDGAPNFELRKYMIRPGGRIPKHHHPDIEHEQFVLSGKYKVGIGDKVHSARPGDSLYIPPGTPHWYENDGNVDAEFLCIVPKKENYDAIFLEEVATTK